MLIARILGTTVFALLVAYFIGPVLHPGNLGFWVFLFFLAAVALIPGRHWDTHALIAVACALAFAAVATGMTWGLTRSDAYYAQLGAETDGSFNELLPPIDINQAPLVSEDMAVRSAEKQLADVPALGSQVELGAFQKQLINGKLYWVSFLQPSSLFKWLSMDGTPGYVRVSATDPTDVKLVMDYQGKPLALRYLPDSYFGSNLERHLYLNGYASRGIASISPEVDETGYPYYVVTFYRNTIGFGGTEASSVAIVDPQTGDIQDYDLKDVPAWADVVQPADLIAHQVANRGEFVHGWFNWSDRDKLRITGTPDLVYGADHRAYWYVGLTSSGNDSGLVGFYLVDSRTKAARRFTLAGATEDVAEHAAEGVIPEKHYSATNPLPFVVAGKPTYVFSLRDNSGIPRAYAMVNIQTFQTLAVGDTLMTTLRLYESALSRDPSANGGLTTQVARQTQRGNIVRMASAVRQGSTYYILSLDTLPGRVLLASTDLSDALPLAQPKDAVVVSFDGSPSGHVYTLTSFSDPTVLPEPASSSSSPSP